MKTFKAWRKDAHPKHPDPIKRNGWKAVKGWAVKIPQYPNLKFFMYRNPKLLDWHVCDVITGLSIAMLSQPFFEYVSDATMKRRVIAKARKNMKQAGIKHFRSLVASVLVNRELGKLDPDAK